MARIDEIQPGDELPPLVDEPDIVQSFLYNAALWNAHRIHFDLPYAQEAEGYPGLVVAGPLMGDWLTQCVLAWLGDDGRLASIEYSNRQAAYIGETLTTSGRVLEVDRGAGTATLEVAVSNAAGDAITPGTAMVRFHETGGGGS
jgi:3-methylfumaryl-CoA hydratase